MTPLLEFLICRLGINLPTGKSIPSVWGEGGWWVRHPPNPLPVGRPLLIFILEASFERTRLQPKRAEEISLNCTSRSSSSITYFPPLLHNLTFCIVSNYLRIPKSHLGLRNRVRGRSEVQKIASRR